MEKKLTVIVADQRIAFGSGYNNKELWGLPAPTQPRGRRGWHWMGGGAGATHRPDPGPSTVTTRQGWGVEAGAARTVGGGQR